MHVYQMRSSVPSVVSASQERISVCMNALKDVSKVWLVAKMVHTLFESILGNKVLEERLQKAAGKRHPKANKNGTTTNTNQQLNGLAHQQQNGPGNPMQSQTHQNLNKRKFDDIDLGFNTGPPAPQVSYERSRPQSPAVTPQRDLNNQSQQLPTVSNVSSPNLRHNDLFPSRGNTRPTTPFHGGYSIPTTPPDFFLVTRNSPPISQNLWENFQPDQLFPNGDSISMPFANASNVDPQLMPQQGIPNMAGQMPNLQQQNLAVPGMNMMGSGPSMNWAGMENMLAGQMESQQEDNWSTSSTSANAPVVPGTLNVEDWFQFFGIQGQDLNGLAMDGS